MHTLQLHRAVVPDIGRKQEAACHNSLLPASLNIIDISFIEDAAASAATGRAVLAEQQMRSLNAYIDERMANRIRTMDLAAALGLSVSHFSRVFKQTEGVSPRIYILRRRIAAACGSMLRSDLHLTDIAYMHGFCDQSHFNRAFNSAYGISPQEWRKLNKPAVRKEQQTSSERYSETYAAELAQILEHLTA
ncbi:Exoenzyme S synthesis regulatory protein ExsA [compost metagenome]